MIARLTKHRTRYAVKQRSGSKSASAMALELGVSRRRIEQPYAEFRRTGRAHMLLKPGRKMRQPTSGAAETVLGVHEVHPAGVLYAVKRLRRRHDKIYGCT